MRPDVLHPARLLRSGKSIQGHHVGGSCIGSSKGLSTLPGIQLSKGCHHQSETAPETNAGQPLAGNEAVLGATPAMGPVAPLPNSACVPASDAQDQEVSRMGFLINNRVYWT